MPRFLSVIFLAMVLAACSLPVFQDKTLSGVVKSVNDHREYRYIELPNQLKVLLVSDVKAKQAAVSLDVHVGSRHDPINRQGLAHFLEHMLFLGTQKYPIANSYQAFVGQHGGSHNAYTSFEHTNYFFDVNNAQLEATLDRFSDFFVQPKFDNAYIEREVNAVESEYRLRIKSENRRIVDATRQLVNPKHPYKKFSVGSLDTLKHTGLRNDLLTFYDQYYSASRMTLAVIANYSLDQLQVMVEERFLAIANKHTLPQPITEPLFDSLPKILSVKLNKPVRQLHLNFPLPDLRAHFKTKPLQYIGNILGDEGVGSLLSALKNLGLAETVSTGIGVNYRGGALFQISVGLTEKGLQSPENIVDLVFLTIKKIQLELSLHPQQAEKRFREQQKISDLAFRFYQQPSERSTVIAMTSNLHFYPWQSVISGIYDYSNYDSNLIAQFVKKLNANNLLMTVAAEKLPIGLAANKKTHWYDVEFASRQIPKEWLQLWQSNKTNTSNDKIQLPSENFFIPSNFELYRSDLPDTTGLGGAKVSNDLPRLVSNELGYRTWMQTDDEFEVPKASFYVAMLSNYQNQSTAHNVLATLYSMAVADQLNEYIYPAYLAGMQAAFYPHLRGFSLQLEGFNDGLLSVLAKVAPILQDITIDESRFSELTKILERRWQASMQAAPHTQLGALLSVELLENREGFAALLSALKDLSLHDLQLFVSEFWSSAYIEALAHGNLNLDEVKKMQALILKQPNCQCEYLPESVTVNETVLNGEQHKTLFVDHSDSAAMWYFQAPDKTLQSVVATMLAASILHPEFYNELRTEQQLGYVVGASYLNYYRQPGLSFTVQSPTATTTQLTDAMQQFIDHHLANGVASQSVFKQQKVALLQNLLQKDASLPERTKRYWHALALGDLSFNRKQQLAKVLEQLSYEQWQAYVAELLDAKNGSLLLTTKDE